MGFLREPSHLLIIAIVIIVLFGSRKLPDAARGLGRSMRIFKSEVRQMKDDDRAADETRPEPPVDRRPEPRTDDPEPLEGRVIRADPSRTDQVRRDL